jgi:pimeloyl-ACP methyl ester carboxylesterase
MHDFTLDLPRGPTRVRMHGEGPPLIWSHGVFFPIDVDNHSTLGRVLDETEGFTIVRYDARGHGRTPAAATIDDHRWDRLGRDVIDLADALGFDRFIAGGISMGAAVTLNAALHARDRVEAMLLLALPTAWESRPAEQQRYRDLAALGSSHAVAEHARRDIDGYFPGGTVPQSLRAMIEHLRDADWPGLERVILGATRSDLPDPRELANLEIPTLLRPWGGDVGHPLSTAEALAKVLPRVEYELMEGFDDADGMRRALEALRSIRVAR